MSVGEFKKDINKLFVWWWADPVAGLLMVLLILKEGWEAIEESRD